MSQLVSENDVSSEGRVDSITRAALRNLISEQRVLSLAVVVDANAAQGLLPYALAADFSGVFIFASALAHHSQGLRSGAPFSILIHDHVEDPLQVARVSFEGEVSVVEQESPEYERARELFLQRFPNDSEVLFTLGDFTMYSLPLTRGRFVQGFARAVDVGADDLKA